MYVAAFCVDAIGYGFMLVVPVRAQTTLDAGAIALGVLGTVSMLAYSLTCVVSGRLSDRIGSHKLYLFGLALVGIVALPVAFLAQQITWLFVGSVLFHAGLGLFWPPLERELCLLSPRAALARTAGTFNCTWAAGICLGTLGGASLYDRLGFDWGIGLFWALFAIAFASLARPFAHPPVSVISSSTEGSSRARRNPPADVIRTFVSIGWIANFAAYFAVQGVIYLFTHLREERGDRIERMGWFLASIHLARLVSFFLLRRSSRWHYSLRFLFGAQLIAAASLIVLSVVENAVYFFALLPLLGLFNGLSYFSSFYYGFQVTTKEGENSGNHELFLSLGATFGPLACGLAAHATPTWPGVFLAVSGGFLLLALLVESRLASRLPRI